MACRTAQPGPEGETVIVSEELVLFISSALDPAGQKLSGASALSRSRKVPQVKPSGLVIIVPPMAPVTAVAPKESRTGTRVSPAGLVQGRKQCRT